MLDPVTRVVDLAVAVAELVEIGAGTSRPVRERTTTYGWVESRDDQGEAA